MQRSIPFLVFVFSLFTSAVPIRAQERGPVLEELISKAEKMRLQVSTVDSLYSAPYIAVQVRNKGSVDLRFDYSVRENQTEWFVNVSADGWKLASELLEQTLLPKKPTRVQTYFIRQIEALLYDKRPLALEVVSEGGSIQKVRALLSRQLPRPREHFAFFPPPGTNTPSIRGEGSEFDFWPLVVLDFPTFSNPVTFQYTMVTVPLTVSRLTGDLRLINTRSLETLLQSQENFKLDVEIRPASAQIFKSKVDPLLDKEKLELAAESPNIAVFASWFVPIWLALYPNAKSLRIKKNLKSSLSVPIDLSPYWGQRCGPFLSQKK